MIVPIKPHIPVVVVTGFLGSGKTTLINRLIRQWPRSALIINEFGATPIDQKLIDAQGIPMAVLSGGCLCCQIKGALASLLKNLWLKWNQSQTPPFERILIEASGVARPEPVLDTLLHERWLARRYHLKGVVATLAAPSAEAQLARFVEAQAQAAWADTLVLTQTDLASEEQITRLESRLAVLAPTTPRLRAIHGDLHPDALLAPQRQGMIKRLPDGSDYPDHGFHSISLRLETKMTWPHLQAALETLSRRYRGRLVRIKGVVHLTDQDHPVIVQGEAGRVHPPVSLPDGPPDDTQGRLVLITDGIVNNLIEDLMTVIRANHEDYKVTRH